MCLSHAYHLQKAILLVFKTISIYVRKFEEGVLDKKNVLHQLTNVSHDDKIKPNQLWKNKTKNWHVFKELSLMESMSSCMPQENMG
jgi:hypothetical protein